MTNPSGLDVREPGNKQVSSSRYYWCELCVHEEFAPPSGAEYTVHSQKKSATAQLWLPGENNLVGYCTFLVFYLTCLLLARVLEPLPAVTGRRQGFLPGHVATLSQRHVEHVDIQPLALVPMANLVPSFPHVAEAIKSITTGEPMQTTTSFI